MLVTGAGSGIGRLIALGAAARGAHVIVWDRAGAAAASVAEEIRADGGSAEHAALDVTDTRAVETAAGQVEARGGVDVLVNNAGVVTGHPFEDASEASVRRTFEVNTLALYWTTRAFLPGMERRRRGRIVTVASAAGLIGVARQSDYSASKFAAIGFTESLRAELRGRRSSITTLTVCPFYIDTGMFDGVRTSVPWLLPILKPQRVAHEVLDAVESGKAMLVLPPAVRLLPVLRALPTAWFDAIADALGVNRSMESFTGRREPGSTGEIANDSGGAVGNDTESSGRGGPARAT